MAGEHLKLTDILHFYIIVEWLFSFPYTVNITIVDNIMITLEFGNLLMTSHAPTCSNERAWMNTIFKAACTSNNLKVLVDTKLISKVQNVYILSGKETRTCAKLKEHTLRVM